ncbi:MAG: hypothetical protein ABWZ15_16170 [Acidimicrobiia bacterium]
MPSTVPRWRRILAWVLLILSCILVPLSVVAVWTKSELLDTDRYVQTVAPLARNAEIQEAVARRLSTLLFDNVDVEKLATDALPSQASFLVGPLESALREFVDDAILRILQTEQFAEFWDEANRRAHAQVERALTGGGPVISTENGRVTLDLSGLAVDVRSRLSERGIGIFDDLPIGTLALRFTLFDADSLEKAQDAIDLLDTLSIVLPILVLVFGVGAVLLAGDRRRMIFRWGVGLIIATLVLGFGIAFGRDLYLDALPESASQPANAQAFDIVVRFLRNSNRIVFLVGLIMALGAWLAGSSKAATFLRSRTTGALEGVGDQAGEGGAFAGVARFVARYVNVFRVGGAVLAFVILIWMDHPDATTVLWLLLALLVYLAVIVVIARMGRNQQEPALEEPQPAA